MQPFQRFSIVLFLLSFSICHAVAQFPPTAYRAEVTDTDVSSRPIDPLKPVGSTAGSPSVNDQGGVNYTIPIYAPPGTNEMQPNLSLQYNSLASNGVVGIGWSLVGLSAIVRTGSNDFQDGEVAPVTFDERDHFMLDGQRLQVTNGGTYGNPGTEYDTELASFAKVTSHGWSDDGPAYFSVVTKEGLYMEFGNASNTRLKLRVLVEQQLAQGPVIIPDDRNVAWHLNLIRDPFGNYMRFNYQLYPTNEVLLLSVEYTGNSNIGIAPYNRLEFSYSERTDKTFNHVGGYGKGVLQKHLLDRIMVKAETQPMKEYQLKYALRDMDRSYLSEIVETGIQGSTRSSYHSTLFKYHESDNSVLEEVVSPTFNNNKDLITGDFDGNGITDIMALNRGVDQYGFPFHNNLELYLNGDDTPHATQPLSGAGNQYFYAYSSYYGNGGAGEFSQISANDFNGDGWADMLISTIQAVGQDNYLFNSANIKASLDLNSSNGFAEDISIPFNVNDPMMVRVSRPWNFLFPADYNGDGKMDLLAITRHTSAASIIGAYILTDVNGGWTELQIPQNAYPWVDHDLIMASDVDGDRKPELHFFRDVNSDPYTLQTFQVDMTTSPPSLVHYNTGIIPTSDIDEFSLQLGDFNGDGNMDLLSRDHNDAWRIHFATGRGIDDAGISFNFSAHQYSSDDKVQVADLNGDGRSDVFHHYTVNGNRMAQVYYSTRDTEASAHFHAEPVSVDAADPFVIMRNGDFNGDGKTDILSVTWPGDTRKYSFGPHNHGRLLHKSLNGMNVQNEFLYENMTGGIHDPGVDVSYPSINVQFPLALCATQRSSNGIGGMNETNYSYWYARFHKARGNFMGFGMTIRESMDLGVQHEARLTFDEDHGLSMPDGTATRYYDGGWQTRSQSSIDQEVVDIAGSQRYYIRTQSSTAYDVLAQSTTIINNLSWDNYGQPLETIKDINGAERETTIVQYTAAGPSSVPTKIGSRTVTKERIGQPEVVKTELMFYSPATGVLEETYLFPGQDKEVRRVYDIDGAGNVFQITTYPEAEGPSVPGSQITLSRETIFHYDAEKRFVTETERLEGGTYVSSSSSFDPKWGEPLSAVSFDGLETTFEYDLFGRLTKQSAPKPQGATRYKVEYQRIWDDDLPKQYYKMRREDPSGPLTETWFDQLGREIRKEVEIIGGESTTTTVEYDSQGRVQTSTEPHAPGEQVVTTTHMYDALDRPVSINSSVRGTITHDYSYSNAELTVTTTKSATGQTRSETTDAAGRTIRATDAGGELDYTYDSWGNLLSVAQGSVTLVENGYDEYGRQTMLTDQSAGTTEYEYDAFGQPVWQMDANGNETNLTYDNIGRLWLREGPEGDTWYSYAEGSDRPTDISGPNMEETFEYDDPFFRLTSYTRSYDGQSFTTLYQYDPLYDRETATTYPNGIQVDRTYDPYGFLDQVQYDGNVLYDAHSMNGRGQITSFDLGNGRTSDISYQHGYPTHYFTPDIQDLELKFNYQTGNLKDRWNKRIEKREFFAYDDLDRLTNAVVHPVDAQGFPKALNDIEYEYDSYSLGDLVQRTDIGKYSYNYHQPTHAHGHDFPNDPYGAPLEISEATQEITYTPFHQPQSIHEEVGQPWTMEYLYGNDQQRCKSTLSDGNGVVNEKWYNGAYEKANIHGDEYEVIYVGSNIGLCAMIVVENGDPHVYPVYTDHLGSIVAVTDVNGDIAAEQDFDPWGRRRDPATWDYYETPPLNGPLPWLYRGYTGHEHIDPFQLINMNGRVYDPLNTRMLSPDNYVMSLTSTQGFNRYAYALNNPLKYTDPSGEVVFVLPTFMWSSYDGWEASITAGVGFPGGASVQATIGYHSQSSSGYFTVGASFAGFTAYVGYGTESGYMAGVGYGFGPMMGGFGTNATSLGISWSQNDGFAAHALGFTYSAQGFGANPSFGFSQNFDFDRQAIQDRALYACDGCPGYLLPEYEVIGYRTKITAAPSSYDNRSNWRTVAGLTAMWLTGYRLPYGGGSYHENNSLANGMRNAYGVNLARDFFYNKYQGATSLEGAFVTNYKGSFGASGYIKAGRNASEQFIGSYRVDILVVDKALQFTLNNTTSFTSFAYGIGPEWVGGPMGNFTQNYVFSEPIDYSRIIGQ